MSLTRIREAERLTRIEGVLLRVRLRQRDVYAMMRSRRIEHAAIIERTRARVADILRRHKHSV